MTCVNQTAQSPDSPPPRGAPHGRAGGGVTGLGSYQSQSATFAAAEGCYAARSIATPQAPRRRY
jgi:hypothetical protein